MVVSISQRTKSCATTNLSTGHACLAPVSNGNRKLLTSEITTLKMSVVSVCACIYFNRSKPGQHMISTLLELILTSSVHNDIQSPK